MKYFITGTMVYGPQTENSDLDIVVSPVTFTNLMGALSNAGIRAEWLHPETYDAPAVYFNLGPVRLNLIRKEGAEFEAWRIATDRMKQLSPIKDRAERLDTFHSFIREALA